MQSKYLEAKHTEKIVAGQWACGDSGLYKGVKIQLSENWVETKFCYDIWLKYLSN